MIQMVLGTQSALPQSYRGRDGGMSTFLTRGKKKITETVVDVSITGGRSDVM